MHGTLTDNRTSDDDHEDDNEDDDTTECEDMPDLIFDSKDEDEDHDDDAHADTPGKRTSMHGATAHGQPDKQGEQRDQKPKVHFKTTLKPTGSGTKHMLVTRHGRRPVDTTASLEYCYRIQADPRHMDNIELSDDYIRRTTKKPGPTKKTTMSLMEAHRLLGHTRDKKAILTYCKDHGITINDFSWDECLACAMTNSRDYVHNGTINRDPGAWSCDFKVYGAPKDLCEQNHALIFVHNLTHYVHAAAIHSRAAADVEPIFAEWVDKFQPTSLHMDNAGEFHRLDKMDVLKNIKTTFTTGGYNPKANGIAERAVGNVNRKCNVQLEAQHLNLRLWDDSFLHATEVMNQTPHRDLTYSTPASFHDGHQHFHCPTKFFLEFGTPVLVHNPPALRQSTDTTRASLGIYIGGSATGFHVITKHGARTSRNVTPLHLRWPEVAQLLPSYFADLNEFFNFTPNDLNLDKAGQNGKNTDDDESEEYEPSVTGKTRNKVDIENYLFKTLAISNDAERELQIGEQVSWKQSQRRSDKDESKAAACKELQGLIDNGVFRIVNKDELKGTERKTLICRLKIKRKLDKYKGRLCVDGRPELLDEVLKKMDRYVPTTGLNELKLLLAVMAHLKFSIYSVDISQAYIHALLDENLIIPIMFEPGLPDEFYPKAGTTYVLNRGLYGLPFAGNLWQNKLKDALNKMGFECLSTQESIFTHRNKDGNIDIIIGVYVDDLCCGCDTNETFNNFKTELEKFFPLKGQKGTILHLGANIHQHGPGSFTLEQRRLAEGFVKFLRLESSKPKDAPLPITAQNGTIDEGAPLSPIQHHQYRSAVGQLSYLTYTRPDLLFARHFLSRFLHKPTTAHWNYLIYVGKYVNGTLDYGLPFRPSDDLDIECYSDSDHATCKDTRQSVTGLYIFCGGNLIQADSNRQKTVANSSTDAEIRAGSYAARQVVGQRQILELLGFKPTRPSKIYIDNNGAIQSFRSSNINRLVKHLATDIALMRNYQKLGLVEFCEIDTKLNISDVGTKPTTSNTFESHRDKILVRINNDGTLRKSDDKDGSTESDPGHVKQQDLSQDQSILSC